MKLLVILVSIGIVGANALFAQTKYQPVSGVSGQVEILVNATFSGDEV